MLFFYQRSSNTKDSTHTLSVLIFAYIYFRELKKVVFREYLFRKWQVAENFGTTYFCVPQVFESFVFINFCKSTESETKNVGYCEKKLI